MERIIYAFIILFTLVLGVRLEERNLPKQETDKEEIMPPIDEVAPDDDPIISLPNMDDETTEDQPVINIKTPIKVYLNPSVQTNNMYYNGWGSEAEHMNDIANRMNELLTSYSYINVDCNCSVKGLTLSDSVSRSNKNTADIHLSLHSNGGGGRGLEVYTKGNDAFAQTMYKGFDRLGEFVQRGVKNGNHLYEVSAVKAPHVALMELLFHDNKEEALFIINNKDLIAKTLTTALIDFIITTYAI